MKKNNILTKEEYQKKIKRCERLGAKQFKKVVQKVEKIKFKLQKRFFPNFTNKINSLWDRKEKKMLKRCSSEEERKQVKQDINTMKMLNKREDNYEMNRNYHLFRNRFGELLNYLNYNKNVHKKGVIVDSVCLPGLVALSTINPIFIPVAILDAISLFLNFQCVNLQNYHIYKIEKNREGFAKKERQAITNTQQNYSEGVKLINKVIESDDKEVSADERLKQIQTEKESLIKAREMILKERERRNSLTGQHKVLKIGGR